MGQRAHCLTVQDRAEALAWCGDAVCRECAECVQRQARVCPKCGQAEWVNEDPFPEACSVLGWCLGSTQLIYLIFEFLLHTPKSDPPLITKALSISIIKLQPLCCLSLLYSICLFLYPLQNEMTTDHIKTVCVCSCQIVCISGNNLICGKEGTKLSQRLNLFRAELIYPRAGVGQSVDFCMSSKKKALRIIASQVSQVWAAQTAYIK